MNILHLHILSENTQQFRVSYHKSGAQYPKNPRNTPGNIIQFHESIYTQFVALIKI